MLNHLINLITRDNQYHFNFSYKLLISISNYTLYIDSCGSLLWYSKFYDDNYVYDSYGNFIQMTIYKSKKYTSLHSYLETHEFETYIGLPGLHYDHNAIFYINGFHFDTKTFASK
jgi:hypothetical protein